MSQVKLDSDNIKPNDSEEDKADPDFEDMPWTSEGCMERMETVNQYVSEVSLHASSSIFDSLFGCDYQTLVI